MVTLKKVVPNVLTKITVFYDTYGSSRIREVTTFPSKNPSATNWEHEVVALIKRIVSETIL